MKWKLRDTTLEERRLAQQQQREHEKKVLRLSHISIFDNEGQEVYRRPLGGTLFEGDILKFDLKMVNDA